MASFRVHLATSTILGAAYGTAAWWTGQFPWGPAALGGGLTAIGGVLPDLDSDSGKPVRELFGVASAMTTLLLFPVVSAKLPPDQTIVALGGVYLFIRYGVSAVFKQVTVHRGMWHSLPAMLIAGLLVFLASHDPNQLERLYLAAGVMIGFFSHLLLDEIYAVDINGVRIRLNNYAGSAIKLVSPSLWATTFTYAILLFLGFVVWVYHSE